MRKMVLYAVIVFQVLLIGSLIRGIQLSRRSVERINDLQSTKDKLLAEQEAIKKQGEYVQSPFYLETVAREELHLSKSGETVVIVPEGTMTEVSSQELEDRKVEKENWQKWWEVLSGSN